MQALCYTTAQIIVFSSSCNTENHNTVLWRGIRPGKYQPCQLKGFLFAFFLGWPLHIRHKNHHLPLHLVCRLLLATLGFITLYCFRGSIFFISFPHVDYGPLVFLPPFPTGLWRFSLSSLSSSLIMTPTSPLPLSELDGVVLSLKIVHIRYCSSSN